MTLPSQVIRAMMAKGASAEVIAAACEAYEQHQTEHRNSAELRAERKREADRNRVASKRAAQRSASDCSDQPAGMSRDIARPSRDSSPAPSSPPTPPLTTPPPVGGDGGGGRAPVTDFASNLAAEVMDALGVSRAPIPRGWLSAPREVQQLVDEGCPPEVIRFVASYVKDGKRGGPPWCFRYLLAPIMRELKERGEQYQLPLLRVVEEGNAATGSFRREGDRPSAGGAGALSARLRAGRMGFSAFARDRARAAGLAAGERTVQDVARELLEAQRNKRAGTGE